jgi:glycine betaine/proline transport system substrate-binding protein
MRFAIFVLVALSTGTAGTADAQMPGKGKSVQPIHNGVRMSMIWNEIVAIGLEGLGYEVKVALEAEIPKMHLAVAEGDADYMPVHWDPLNLVYYERSGGAAKLQKVGRLIKGVGEGYLIDKATADEYGIDNLGQFADPKIARLFDVDGDGTADLMGCNRGWSCARAIDHHIDAYELRETVAQNQGVYFNLIADTIARFKQKKPIFYYTWTPMWVSGVLVAGKDVKYLNVPFSSVLDEEGADTALPDGRNRGFAANDIRVLANNQFLRKNPAAEKLFELMKIELDAINARSLLVHDGQDKLSDIRLHAESWAAEHRATLDQWIAEVAAAAD